VCGRYARQADKQRIAEAMDAGIPVFELGRSYNAAPQSFQPVVRLNRDTGEREIVLMRWGLIPFWSKDQKIAYSTINAKAETIATNPAFREAIKHRRCLVPADAFYEWQKLDGKTKQPYAIALRNGEVYAFAGLWERWKDKKTATPLETFTIITTDPNELVEPLHTRMPVIVPRKDYDRWLSPCAPELLPLDLLRAYPAEEMTAWRVDLRVGNVMNDDPELIVEAESAGTVGLFS
jgi:putative SOS response-associated peptidase YedK